MISTNILLRENSGVTNQTAGDPTGFGAGLFSGVAAPCLEIAANPLAAYKYTARGNLVAVISNGTAVLGLGNIGALAGKPVMEERGSV